MDPDSVAKAFVEHYYSTFDANRAGLANLYQDSSMLTFEGQKIQGSQNIVAKLTSLPFQQCKHSITTVDCQPSGPAGGMLVFDPMKSPGFVYVSNRQVYSLDDLIVVMDFSSLWNLVDFHVVSLVHLDDKKVFAYKEVGKLGCSLASLEGNASVEISL
ncbi:hypothetical protein TIFTF001_018430 [Ficus carica]|uniref:NTF2 domain-containing protein n=1 Tax=Ficus carica TaxID=3494 RepID=A0AA88A719_FICCA|nr:hypothetical protein TIFTF001_018430 [Ficus carica]